ncbi:MAG: DUF6519 domain-containing protein, partial [Crocosphaera sp.]|nr:DUF6519 domain-containing protein [Crocosphaera sp.]
MKGDITRLTFDPKKHYTSVRMQQGRLQLDADWNEQVDIDNHLRRAQILASLGSENGVPIYNPETQESESNSFKLTIIDQGKDIQITPGHLYISGTLCELELGTPFDATIKDSQPEKLQLEVSSLVIDGREIQKNQWLEDIEKGEQYQIETVDRQKRTLTLITTGKTDKKTIKLRRLSTYTTQPDYLNPPTRNTSNPSNTNLKPGFYLAYIDVWERHITTIEDNSLREIALNSPDTTTRTKTVWQLKLLNIQEAAEKQLLNFVKQIEVIDNKKEAKTKLIDELKGLIKSQKQITEADFKNKFNELTKTNQQRKFTELLTQYNNNVSQEGAEKLRDFVNAIEVTTQDKKDAKNKLVNELAKLIKSQENITEEKRSSFENEFNELTKSDEQRRFTELLTQYNDNVRLEKAEKLIDFVKKIEVTEDKKDAHTKLIDELKVFIKSQKQITEEKRSSFKNKFNELTKTDKQKEFTELLTQYKNNISQEGAEKLREFVNEIEVTTEDKKDAKNKLIDELTKLIESQEKITEEKLSSFKNKFNELTKTNQQRKFTELLTQYNDNISQERDELEENSDKIWKEFVGNNNNRFTEAKMNACALLCDNSITGYQRLENQLYRVEIHQSGIIGDDTSPTFKWSRENGSIASPIVGKIEGNTINIQPSSNDAWSSSQPGQQWIEMTSEEQELKGIPGVLAPINRVISGTKIEFGNPTNTNGENLTKVRRWDSNEIEIKSPEWIDLEGGIKVKFSSKLAYETGDYWLIPARTATNDIEWPNDNGEPAKPIPQLPRGIRHDYARLGLVKINEEGGFEGPEQEGEILDKRIIFPSLQNSFDKVNGGDITGNVTIKAKLGVTGKVTITDTLDVDNSTNLATQKGNVAIGSDSHQAELGVTGKVTITDTLDVDNSTNLATQKG